MLMSRGGKFGFELRGRSDGQLVIGADIGTDEMRDELFKLRLSHK